MALLPPWLPLPSTFQTIELFAALSAVFGMYFVVSKTMQSDSDLKWMDLLVAVGAFIVPGIILLAMERILPPVAGALVLGLMLGHTMAMLDDD